MAELAAPLVEAEPLEALVVGDDVAPATAAPPAEAAPAHDEASPTPDDIPPAVRAALEKRYEIICELGRGGMGVVYKAHDRRLKRTVALKLLLAGEGASEETVKRFVQEARAAGSLQHPNIVRVHDIGKAGGQYFFTMDYIEGKSLEKVFAEGGLETEQALRVFVKVADALQTAHERGIIHRDIKPANIILDSAGEPHVMDFGLAKDVNAQTMLSTSGTLLGTPAYMSPEAAAGDIRSIDARSDVYSMGIILYEMISRVNPFQGATLYDTISKVVRNDPPTLRQFDPHVNRDLDTICLKALEKRPQKRYQSMKELADDVRAYLEGRPISASPPTPLEKAVRAAKKNPLAYGFTATGVILFILVLLTLATMEDPLDRLSREAAGGDAGQRAAAVREISRRLAEGKIAGESKKRQAAAAIGRSLTDAEPSVRLEGIKAVRRNRLSEHAETIADLAKKDADEKNRAAAVEALTACGYDKSDMVLRDILLDPEAIRTGSNRLARLAAVRGLGQMSGHTPRLALQRTAENTAENDLIRAEARKALESMPAAAPDEIASGLQDSARKGDLAGMIREGIKAGQDINRAGPGSLFNNAMAQMQMAMADMGPAIKVRPKDVLLKEIKSSDPDKRLQAAYELGKGADRTAKDDLFILLADKDPDVSRAAANALIRIREVPSDEMLGNMLTAESPALRTQAAYLIAQDKRVALAESLALALGAEKDPPARREMMASLAAIAGPQHKALFSQIAESDADPLTRKLAVRLLADFSPAPQPSNEPSVPRP